MQAKVLPTGPVAHAIEIADGIKASGLGCDNAALEYGSGKDSRIKPAKEEVSCDSGDDSLAITVFGNHDGLARNLPNFGKAVCFVNATRPQNLTFVEGDNWVVTSEHAATAHLLADALHAALQTIRC